MDYKCPRCMFCPLLPCKSWNGWQTRMATMTPCTISRDDELVALRLKNDIDKAWNKTCFRFTLSPYDIKYCFPMKCRQLLTLCKTPPILKWDHMGCMIQYTRLWSLQSWSFSYKRLLIALYEWGVTLNKDVRC